MVGVGVVSGSFAHSIFYPSDVHNQITALGWQFQKRTGRETSKRAVKATETEGIRREQPAANDMPQTEGSGFTAELAWPVPRSSEALPENSVTKAAGNRSRFLYFVKALGLCGEEGIALCVHHDVISRSGITAGNQFLRTQGNTFPKGCPQGNGQWEAACFVTWKSFKPRLERPLARAAAERICVYWSARAQTIEMPFLTVLESRSPRPGVGRFGFLRSLSPWRCSRLLLFPHLVIP